MKKLTALASAFSLCVILIFSITTHSAGSESAEEIVKEELLSEEDISLIALVTMAEAEGECEKGKRLVIDTILRPPKSS